MMDFDPSANSKEYLWSTKLTKKSNKTQWEGRDDGVLEQLVLKRACLGVGAKENERNIVQVTSFNYQQKKIETCICSLTLPTKECDGLTDVTVFPPAIFELVEGSGPIHLTGNHMMMDDGDESDDEDFDEEGMEEDEEVSEDSDGAEEEEEEETKIVEIKSDPPPAKVNGVAEKKQVAEVKPQVKDEAPAEEEKEESKEEEAEEKMEAEVEEAPAPVVEEKVEEKPKKTPKKNKKRKLEEKPAEENVEAAPAAAAEEKPKTPAKKKKAAAAAADGAAEEAPKTPKNKQKENKTPKKTPAKVYTTLDEVAAAVKKYPGGKPRKEDKFGNWVKSAFKVHNDEWIPQLWKMHKKDAGL